MQRVGSRDVFRALVTQRKHIDAGEKVFAGAKKNRADSKVHLVNEFALEVLPDRCDPAAEPDVATIGCVNRPLQCGMDPVRDEVEGRAAVPRD